MCFRSLKNPPVWAVSQCSRIGPNKPIHGNFRSCEKWVSKTASKSSRRHLSNTDADGPLRDASPGVKKQVDTAGAGKGQIIRSVQLLTGIGGHLRVQVNIVQGDILNRCCSASGLEQLPGAQAGAQQDNILLRPDRSGEASVPVPRRYMSPDTGPPECRGLSARAPWRTNDGKAAGVQAAQVDLPPRRLPEK